LVVLLRGQGGALARRQPASVPLRVSSGEHQETNGCMPDDRFFNVTTQFHNWERDSLVS
jgi:hypothetical protein